MKKRTKPPTSSCCSAPPLPRAATLRQIVDHYIGHYRPSARREQRRFRDQPSIVAAVDLAGRCEDADGKRHSHQRRIPAASLERMRRVLSATDLMRAKSFDDLHEAIRAASEGIHMIGPLTVYDVATRIGFYLRLQPRLVYLHAGVRPGAKALGLDHRRPTLARSELPTQLQRLTPAECEDVLCIYADKLRAANRRRARPLSQTRVA